MTRLVAALCAVGTAVAIALVPQAPAHAITTSQIEFGINTSGVAKIQADGADLAFGTLWAGKWNDNGDWGGIRDQIRRAKADQVAPMIQWYYWGDGISTTCVENENTSLCGGRTKTEWNRMADELAAIVYEEMQGARAVVILETEFNKNGVASYEPFDAALAAQARKFDKPGIQTAVGFGHWASQTVISQFDQAMNASEYAGTMILFSCVKETRATYTSAVQKLIDNATMINNTYNKPLFVSDFGLSSYDENAGDSAYSASNPDHQCINDDYYAGLQEAEIQEIFDRRSELKAAGITAICLRALEDEINRDPVKDFHKIAERWFGIRRNNVAKPAYNNFIDGVKSENGSTPPPPPPPTSAEWKGEAELFTNKPVGGACTSTTASAGACWNLWSNGGISTTTTSLTSGTKQLTVVALGDPAGGTWPTMDVYVDNVKVGTYTVGDDVWLGYSIAVTLGSGTHTVEVRYTNDGTVDGNDRNLLVDYAQLSASAPSWSREAESFDTKSAGGNITSTGASGGAYWNLWSNGNIATAMSVPYTSQHQIQVVARGDVAGGVWPQMKVYVDNVLIATQTVAATSWTTYSFTTSITGGTHTLKIEFTNDDQVNGEDRNLKLDLAKLHT